MPDQKTAIFTTAEGFKIEVRILAERSNFGRRDVQIEPTHGAGIIWVIESKLEQIQGE